MGGQIPNVQRAACIANPGPDAAIHIRDHVRVEEPALHQIVVKIAYSGLCGSELRALRGWGAYNSIVGHEGVGTVVKLGEAVSGITIGERVGVKWLFSACGECPTCLRGHPHYCPKQLNTGRHVPGTFQQYVVADSRYVTRIPDAVSSELACPLLCAGLTMMGAVDKLDGHLSKGDWVVISGAGGGLGHLGVQIASRLKGYRVIAIDSQPSKRDLSLKSGAECFIDFAEENIEERVKALTGEGAAAVLAVSGSEAAFQVAPLVVRNCGYIVSVGLPRNDFNLPISATLCSARGLTVMGVAVGTEKQMEELLDFAAKGQISPRVEVLDFDQVPEAIQRLKDDKITGRIVVKMPE